MAIDEVAAERVRKALAGSPDVVEKRMFGGGSRSCSAATCAAG